MNLTQSELNALYRQHGAQNDLRKQKEIRDKLVSGGMKIVPDHEAAAPRATEQATRSASMGTTSDPGIIGKGLSGLGRSIGQGVESFVGGTGDLLQSINPLNKDDIQTRLGNVVKGASRQVGGAASIATSPLSATSNVVTGKTLPDIAGDVGRTVEQAIPVVQRQASEGMSLAGQGLREFGQALVDPRVGSRGAEKQGMVPGSGLGHNPFFEPIMGKVVPGLMQTVTSPVAGAVSVAPEPVQEVAQTIGEVFTYLPDQGARMLGYDPDTDEGRAIMESLMLVQDAFTAGIGRNAQLATRGLGKKAAAQANILNDRITQMVRERVQPVVSAWDKLEQRAKEMPQKDLKVASARELRDGIGNIIQEINRGLDASSRKTEYIKNLPEKLQGVATRLMPMDVAAKDLIMDTPGAVEVVAKRIGEAPVQVERFRKLATNPDLRRPAMEMWDVAKRTEGDTSPSYSTTDVLGREVLRPIERVKSVLNVEGERIGDRMDALKNNVIEAPVVQDMISSIEEIYKEFKLKRGSDGHLDFDKSTIADSVSLKKAIEAIDARIRPYREVTPSVTRNLGVEIQTPPARVRDLLVDEVDTWRKNLFNLQDAISETTTKAVPQKVREAIAKARSVMLESIGDEQLSNASRRYAIADDVMESVYKFARENDERLTFSDLERGVGTIMKRLTGEGIGGAQTKNALQKLSNELGKLDIDLNVDNLLELARFNEDLKKKLFPPTQRGGLSGEMRAVSKASEIASQKGVIGKLDSILADYIKGPTSGAVGGAALGALTGVGVAPGALLGGIGGTIMKKMGIGPGPAATREFLDELFSTTQQSRSLYPDEQFTPKIGMETTQELLLDLSPKVSSNGKEVGGTITTSNGKLKYEIDGKKMIIENVEAFEKRKGTGKALMEEAEKHAKEKGLDRIELSAFPQDGSITSGDLVNFYENLGYVVDYVDDILGDTYTEMYKELFY